MSDLFIEDTRHDPKYEYSKWGFCENCERKLTRDEYELQENKYPYLYCDSCAKRDVEQEDDSCSVSSADTDLPPI